MLSLAGRCASDLVHTLSQSVTHADVISFIGTHWLLHPPYTKVHAILSPYERSVDFGSLEMHGNEDGTIPATFQVIYVVRLRQIITVFGTL